MQSCVEMRCEDGKGLCNGGMQERPKKSDHLQGQVDKQYDVVTETVLEESVPLRL
jgi:hypothetical protein